MGILPGSGPLGSGPTGPGSGFSVMPPRSFATASKHRAQIVNKSCQSSSYL